MKVDTADLFEVGGEDAGAGGGGAGAAGRSHLRGEPHTPATGRRIPPPQSGSRDEADLRLASHLIREQARPPNLLIFFFVRFRFLFLILITTDLFSKDPEKRLINYLDYEINTTEKNFT